MAEIPWKGELLCWNWNIPGELGQYHSCWWPGSLCRQVISSSHAAMVLTVQDEHVLIVPEEVPDGIKPLPELVSADHQ